MIRAAQKKKRKKQRLYVTILLVFLSAAAGLILHSFPPSLQEIGRFARLAAGRITEQSADTLSADAVLRGTIFDRNFHELAVSYRLYALYVHPSELNDRREAARLLSAVIGEKEDVLLSFLKQRENVVKIADNLDQKQVEAIKELNLIGVNCKPFEKRFYPQNETAAQLVGFWGSGRGLAGVEGRFDTILNHGSLKEDIVPEIDFSGADMSGISRRDLVLSLDLGLQKKIEQDLKQYLRWQHSGQGLALLLQPKTGAILALVSLPAFNPNYFWQAPDANRNSLMGCRLEIRLIRPLLVRASAVLAGGELGSSLLPETVAVPDFGIHEQDIEQTAALIGLRDSVSGQLPAFADSEPKSGPGDGGLNKTTGVSALQVAATVSALMNGGWKTEPYVLQSVHDHGVKRLLERSREYTTAGRHRIMSPSMGIRMRRELIGSGRAGRDDLQQYQGAAVRVFTAGGTSHYVMQDLTLAMIPREMPEMLLLMATSRDVLLPLSASGESGVAKLAAVAGKLLPSLYKERRTEKMADVPDESYQSNYERFLIGSRVGFDERQTDSGAKGTMPEVTGCSLRKGLQRLNRHKVQVRVKGSGVIVAQTPLPGAPLNGVDECVLTLESKI